MAEPFSEDRLPPKYFGFFQRAKVGIRLFYQKAMNDKLFDRAGSVAFQAVFSIIPIIALAYVIFALSGGLASMQESVERWAVNNLAPSLGDQVISYLRTIQEKMDPKTIGIFGLLAFLWAGINMISKTEKALNGLWGLSRTRPFFKRLWLYPLALIIAPIVLGASFLATSFLAGKTDGNDTLSAALLIPMAIIPWVITGCFFSLIYWGLPYTTVSRRAAVRAGFLTGVVFELLKQGYAIYAANSIGHSVYGSLAALPILLVWISLSSTVFMLGAELCYFLDMREQGVAHVARLESHLSFPLLVDILRIFQHTDHPVAVKGIVKIIKWDQSDVFRHVHYLADAGLIKIPKGFSKGNERYQAVELNFEAAVEKLLRQTNEIKYEQLELPKLEKKPRFVSPKPANPVNEKGATLVDRIWSPWGARRKPHHTV